MNHKKKVIISWVLLLSWMAFIFYMSHQTGAVSSSQSGRIVGLLYSLGIVIPQEKISLLTFIIRKAAHISEYFILYILLYNVLKNYMYSKKIIIYSIIGVVLYAASDELHQYFIPGRSAEIKDVFIDSCGGIVASILNNLFYKYKKR